MDVQSYLDFAVETALQAGLLTLKYFQHDLTPEFKPDHSPVTIADRESEQFIRRRIARYFPDHAILGEEYGEETPVSSSRYRWIIDPIDGTRSFVRGVPMYAVLIGLEIDGEVQGGVAHFPALEETLAAGRGIGCWWNGRRTHVSGVEALKNAYLVHSDVASFAKHGQAAAWERIIGAVEYRAGWSDAYGYLLVATGRAEVMLDAIMAVWDCGPFPVILAEAGGYFGDWQGNSTIYTSSTLATTQKLLPQVLSLLIKPHLTEY